MFNGAESLQQPPYPSGCAPDTTTIPNYTSFQVRLKLGSELSGMSKQWRITRVGESILK
jgi:hypothetical protein